MKLLFKLSSNLVLAFNVLVLFVFLFESRMEFPLWLQSIGRMHPLLLHLPIGVSLLALIFVGLEKQFEAGSIQKVILFLLHLAALTASLTALMGLILGTEGGYGEEVIERHRNAGVAMSFLLWITLFLYSNFRERKVLFRSFLILSIGCLILTGHLGSVITHGENYVLEPLSPAEMPTTVNDSTSLYVAAVFPILENKCISCHNPKKSKGGLIMTSAAGIVKGGEHGPPWIAGSPEKSLLVKRIMLPEEHKEHMPPSGKAQLNVLEAQLLYQWILSGADSTLAWTKFSPADSVRRLAEKFIQRSQGQLVGPVYTFPAADDAKVESLNDPYRTVAPVAINEPGLIADFYLREKYESSRLEELLAVREQLVSLNLGKMPVSDADCRIIRQFVNLEKLNLNFSSITGEGLKALSDLENLKTLSIAGTQVDKNAVEVLGTFKSLKEVFVWNTQISPVDLSGRMPAIQWNMGYIPDEKEMLALTPPILLNENTVLGSDEGIMLRHNFPGTVIRYTLDGSEPDSLSAKIFDQPLHIDRYTIIKTKACKTGWYCSKTASYPFFKKGINPLTTTLLTAPNKDYKGEGSKTLVDSKKGDAGNFRDAAWLGYREGPLVAEFSFGEGASVKEVTVSFARNIPSFLMPPEKLEVWAGADAVHAKLIHQQRPTQPTKIESTKIEVISIPVETASRYFRIVVTPVPKLPKWHSGKGQKGWVFVDEIFFN